MVLPWLPVVVPPADCSLFGTKVIVAQPVFKAVPGLFESKDGKARDKVKELLVQNHKHLHLVVGKIQVIKVKKVVVELSITL